MKHLILLLLLFIPGCFFGRVDVVYPDGSYLSTTVVTLFKDITIDPNSYESKSKPVKALAPWGWISSE